MTQMLRRFRRQITFIAMLLMTTAETSAPAQQDLPTPDREFRGVWVATVYGLDWPRSEYNTTASRQDLLAIVQRAEALNLNAIVFQVRPESDAFYPSDLEPWSRWMAGASGRAPSPAWDPLEYIIGEAHARGIELHAWFNPYRAGVSNTDAYASTHISRTRPDIVRSYDGYYWLDPGHPDAQAHSLAVIRDVLDRYDVDGVHFDDYFYPYPEDGVDFPDDATYQAYLNDGGNLGRADWRRQSVDSFIQDVDNLIAQAAPHVKFGIAPFGIWRPGNPPGVTGLDAYSRLYADSRRWLMEGWVDYLAPQLYWPIDSPGQSFPALLDWWTNPQQNPLGRHVMAGLAPYRLGNEFPDPEEINNQIAIIRELPAVGEIHFRELTLAANHQGVRTRLEQRPYADEALPPVATWLDDQGPAAPTLQVSESGSTAQLSWEPADPQDLRRWILWQRPGPDAPWTWRLFNPAARGTFINNWPEGSQAVIAAIDRQGNIGEAAFSNGQSDGKAWMIF